MKTSDLLLTIFIMFIFVVLNLFNVLGTSLNHVQKNWPKYRCNPSVIPFAGFFGHDPSENFSYCIQNMQTSRMGDLLSSSSFQISNLSDQMGSSNDTSNSSRGFLSNLRGDFSNIVGGIMSTFLNLLIEVQKLVIDIKDLFAKLSGIMATQLFLLSGSLLTIESTWAGPPGQIVRALCFHPDTLVKTLNNKIVKMKDIQSGDRLKNGKIVHVTMNIHNLDKNGKFIEDLYEIEGGENDQKIIVSGTHLIFDSKQQNFIFVKDSPKSKLSNTNSEKLACLITEDHLIPLGKYIFHDWEDNNGSPSKSI